MFSSLLSTYQTILHIFRHSLIALALLLPVIIHAEESKEMADKSETMMAEKGGAMAEKESMMADKESMMSDDKKMAEKGINENTADKRNIQLPVDLQEQYQSDLAHYTQTDEMLVGSKNITTLFAASNSANNKGIVILFPDWQQPAITPKSISFLHNSMPEHGWATMTIQPLNKPNNYPSNALEANTRLEENTKAINDYQEQLAEIYLAAMEKAAAMPGLILLISEGNNAGILTNIVNQTNTLKPNAMVLLSAYQSTQAADKEFAKQLAMSDIPVLDLYLKQDNQQVKPSAVYRKKQAVIELKVVYRQKQLSNFTPTYYPHTQLLKEIQGWLKVIGW